MKAVLMLASWLAAGVIAEGQDQEQRPVFRAGTSRVSLNVVVKDGRGRPITNLAPKDFQVFDGERAVNLDDFRTGEDNVSIALLIDTSGSMGLGEKMATTRQTADMLLAQFNASDEAALFTFAKTLHEVVPFSTNPEDIRRGMDRVKPYGATSLHDAAAAAARELASRPSSRRAVVAITDGFDNASALTASAASEIASGIDVPIYVLVVARDKKEEKPGVNVEPVEGGGVARLDDLTGLTGGASFAVEKPAETSLAVRHILADLRAGYLLGFTPSERPGWHRLTVRVARKDARVRTRAGFWMGAVPGSR
jgi:Ca-activated chloride channel family protein